eukprot:jgi/Chlat1/6628/Chrsp482S06114
MTAAAAMAMAGVVVARPKAFVLPARRPSSSAAVRSWRRASPILCMAQKWVLVPSGDGDTRHLPEPTPMPGAIDLSDIGSVVIGREAEKADAVLPVATVSGKHARLDRRAQGEYWVSDLGSTNGTYINGSRLKPNQAARVNPGVEITFGDVHLAKFVLKVEEEEDKPAEPEAAEAPAGAPAEESSA